MGRIQGKFSEGKEAMIRRFKKACINALVYMPVLLTGLVFFMWATGAQPNGSLLDFRIKLAMVFGKTFIAVYLGQILQNLLFPFLEETNLDRRNIDAIQPKMFNIMYGRLIIHVIMQIVFIYV